jgi:hypothetical protein
VSPDEFAGGVIVGKVRTATTDDWREGTWGTRSRRVLERAIKH